MSLRILFICLVSLVLSGCSGPVPSALMKSAFMKANEGKYSDANEFLCEFLKKHLSTEELRQEFWDKVTKQKSITGIDIQKEDEQRVSSTVDFKVSYKDGTSIETKEVLIKENGFWRLASMHITQPDKARSEKQGFQTPK